MKPNPFPLQLSLLAKAPQYVPPEYGPPDNRFSNGSTPENFIAPGGEWYFTEEARRIFLEMTGGNAEKAHKLMQNALDQHNALYWKDQQPRGLEGRRLPIPKEKRDPENPDPWHYANRGYDPTALISEINRQKDWPLHDGETQDQANARMDKYRREKLPESMEQFTVPHKIINPEPLRNSFAKAPQYVSPEYGPPDDGFSNGSTPEDFIAPGGEWVFTPEAKKMYLEDAGVQKATTRRGLGKMVAAGSAAAARVAANQGPSITADPTTPYTIENTPKIVKLIQNLSDVIAEKYDHAKNTFKSSNKMNNIDNMPLHDIYNQLSKSYKTPAWQRKEGQNPKGGLNAKGRASAKAEGHNLKAPVKSGDNPRRASFLARMGNSPGPEYDEHGKPTRLLLALQAWGASSKADARRKAKAISARLKMRKSEAENPPDVVHLEVPLLIRLLEYAREDASSDVDLHEVVETMVDMSQRGNVLGMSSYRHIVNER